MQVNKFVPKKEGTCEELDAKLYGNNRIDCVQQKTFCFTDSDCALQCTYNTNHTCAHGICSNHVFQTTETTNECAPEHGMIAYLQGDTAFGRYEFICKSEDPGIAISKDLNRMCLNGTIKFDYRIRFPAISDCKCSDGDEMIVVPATRNKRRHVECSKKIAGFVEYP